MMSCNCEGNCRCDKTICHKQQCRCTTNRANNLRSDVEYQMKWLMGRRDLAITEYDGLVEDKLALMKELREMHKHFMDTEGAMCVTVNSRRCVPTEFDMDAHHCGHHHHHGHPDHCRCFECCNELEGCQSCYEAPCDVTCDCCCADCQETTT